MFHGRFLLKIQIQAKIENPLKRISETVSGHFRVPHLKVGQDEQVGRIEIDPRLIHLHLSGPLHRQRIADFEFFEPQERSVPKPAFCKGFFRCLFIYFRGSASVALMRGSASVPMIYRVLPVLHLCVVPVAF